MARPKVKCIYFQSEADLELEAMLKKIAKDSGGEYTAIAKSEMQ